MTIWIHDGHRVDLVDPNDIDTWVVLRGTKSAKQLVQENMEQPDREWLNPGGQPLPDPALKGLATAYKNKYKLDSLTIRGQVG